MKKAILLSAVFALFLMFFITACKNTGEPADQIPEAPPTASQSDKNDSPPLDEAVENSGNQGVPEQPDYYPTALLIIDIQNDYFEEGSHALYGAEEALGNAEYILKKFRDEGLPIIHVQHLNNAGASFFAEGTWGAEIHENLTPLENERLIVKRQVSSFAGTELEEILKEMNIETLVICGMQTNVCVNGTVRDAEKLDFNVILLEDACAALNSDIHESAITALAGDYALIVKTSDF